MRLATSANWNDRFACRPKPNGKKQRAARMAVASRGATSFDPACANTRESERVDDDAGRQLSRPVPRPMACSTWPVMSGSGHNRARHPIPMPTTSAIPRRWPQPSHRLGSWLPRLRATPALPSLTCAVFCVAAATPTHTALPAAPAASGCHLQASTPFLGLAPGRRCQPIARQRRLHIRGGSSYHIHTNIRLYLCYNR